MDGDEPALVPQWLKGGATSASAFGGHNNGTALRDLNSSTKRNASDWDDKPTHDRYKPVRNPDSLVSKSAEDIGSWKQPQNYSSASVTNGRPPGARPFDDRLATHEPARGRPGSYPARRVEARNGYDTRSSFSDASDSVDKRKAGDVVPSGQVQATKGVFEKNFPTLGEQKPPSYTPAVAPYKQNYLASKASGNWTSKLADSPSTPPPATEQPPSFSPITTSASVPTPATPPPASQNGGPKMSEALQQTLSSRANSADRQRLDQLAVKQSRQLIPVISSKTRTTAKFTPIGRFDTSKPAARAPDPRKVLDVPAPSPFARKPTATASLDRSSSSIARAGSAPLPAAQQSSGQPAAPPSGMISLKPTVSGKTSERTSFFDSLRRKTSLPDGAAGEQLSEQLAAESATASKQALLENSLAAEVSDAAAARATAAAASPVYSAWDDEELVPVPSNGSAGKHQDAASVRKQVQQQQQEQQEQQEQGQGAAGKVCTKLQDIGEAEEVAFLRLLGWEEPEEGEDEGLTEEEIAAFKAAAEARPPTRPQPLLTSTTSLKQAVHSMMASSYGSNVSFSDTDSD